VLRKWKRACNNSLASLILPLTLMLSACDVQGLSSDAYILGKETGATWRDLSDEIEVISSWVDEESGDLNAIMRQINYKHAVGCGCSLDGPHLV